MNVGDWAVRLERGGLGWEHSLTLPYRISRSNDIVIELVGLAEYWGCSMFRPATPEEIAAVPIKKGDVVTPLDPSVSWDIKPAWEGIHAPNYRHATAEEYRNATSVIQVGDWVTTGWPRTGRVTKIDDAGWVNLFGDGAVRHCGSIRLATAEEIAAVPIKKGDWISPGDYACGYEVHEAMHDGNYTGWRHATAEEYRAATAPPGWTGNTGAGTVEGPQVDGPFMTTYTTSEAAPVNLSGFADNLAREAPFAKYIEAPMTEDEPLEQSGSDLELDPEAVEAQFAAMAARLSDLEAKPQEPEGPVFWYDSITGEGPYVIVDAVDDRIGVFYAGKKGTNPGSGQAGVRLWTATLTTVRPTQPSREKRAKDAGHMIGHSKGWFAGRSAGVLSGTMWTLASVCVFLTVSLVVLELCL